LDPKVFHLLNLALAFYNVGTMAETPPYWVLMPVGLSLLGSIVLIWYHLGN
jgi:hypothetical protein